MFNTSQFFLHMVFIQSKQQKTGELMKIQPLLSLLLLSLCSCAGLGHKVDSERAMAVKKVAIVAIEIQQQKPTDNLGFGAFNELKNGSTGNSKELQTMAKNISNTMIAQLQKKTGWKVSKMEDVVANSDYKKKFSTAMNGVRNVVIFEKNTEAIFPKDTLDLMAFRKMSLEERQQLAKSLGVDALAEVMITNTIDQSSYSFGHLTGDADFTFTARANLQVFDSKSTEPIWMSQNNQGEETISSGSLAKEMSKLEKLSKLGEEASNSAILKLIETYPL